MRILIAGVLALAACGGTQRDVAVEGKDTELVHVAGDWSGSYTGKESGRTGTIQFSLVLGRHTADGQVVMEGATPLKIEFVSVKAGQVKGTIAPYTDPNCKCQVETSFLGTVEGDKITGMFETKIGKTGQIQTGEWSVSRTSK